MYDYVMLHACRFNDESSAHDYYESKCSDIQQ